MKIFLPFFFMKFSVWRALLFLRNTAFTMIKYYLSGMIIVNFKGQSLLFLMLYFCYLEY